MPVSPLEGIYLWFTRFGGCIINVLTVFFERSAGNPVCEILEVAVSNQREWYLPSEGASLGLGWICWAECVGRLALDHSREVLLPAE